MANLRVFVSSTAYDLGVLRSALRGFIQGLGYDPVLSDYSDVVYDPREHAHKSCIAEVQTCDMVVLVIGSRFGSDIQIDSLEKVTDQDVMRFLEDSSEQKISITQAEALTAANCGIPIFAFVEAGVHHDYSVFQRNKNLEFASKIVYPSIAQAGNAEYIFNFIDFLQGRSYNNAVIAFDRMEEVMEHLQKQWAGLFQRMLAESRTGRDEGVRIDRLADQFEDLKAALLASFGDAGSRAAARAVVRYRRLLDFLRQLPSPHKPMREAVVDSQAPFWEMLRETAGVVSVGSGEDEEIRRYESILELDSGAKLLARFPSFVIDRLANDWQTFQALPTTDRAAAFDALVDLDDAGRPVIRPFVERELRTRPTSTGTDSLEPAVSPPSAQVVDPLLAQGKTNEEPGSPE
ncbi:DUF4062 domain-containing protein [Nocardioidaceae bacterium]|nr:DUF4062 domain-containing protein [Nocardioidaceae bacterium]